MKKSCESGFSPKVTSQEKQASTFRVFELFSTSLLLPLGFLNLQKRGGRLGEVTEVSVKGEKSWEGQQKGEVSCGLRYDRVGPRIATAL